PRQALRELRKVRIANELVGWRTHPSALGEPAEKGPNLDEDVETTRRLKAGLVVQPAKPPFDVGSRQALGDEARRREPAVQLAHGERVAVDGGRSEGRGQRREKGMRQRRQLLRLSTRSGYEADERT